MKKIFVFIILGFCQNLFADNSQWTLSQKIQGPASWNCPEKLTLSDTPTKTQVQWPPMSEIILDDLNQGTICTEASSSQIFGGVRCSQNIRTETAESILFENRMCTRNLFIYTSCDPLKEKSARTIEVLSNKKLIVTDLINWDESSYLICEYSAN